MRSVKQLLLFVIAITITSCATVRVSADYDSQTNFNQYKTFAFYKPGIDKAEISDLDKKRILRAIEKNMLQKGFTKSKNPDLLVSFFAKAKTRIDVHNNNWGGLWGPWGNGFGMWGNFNTRPSITERTNGILYIDLIDSNKKQLTWQGKGTAPLVHGNVNKREERINEIVSKILENYPPTPDAE